jgi:hypothetical protein
MIYRLYLNFLKKGVSHEIDNSLTVILAAGNQSPLLVDCGAQYLDGTTDISRYSSMVGR